MMETVSTRQLLDKAAEALSARGAQKRVLCTTGNVKKIKKRVQKNKMTASKKIKV